MLSVHEDESRVHTLVHSLSQHEGFPFECHPDTSHGFWSDSKVMIHFMRSRVSPVSSPILIMPGTLSLWYCDLADGQWIECMSVGAEHSENRNRRLFTFGR